MTPVAHSPKKGYRTIRLPLAESEYDRFLTNRAYAKARLEEFYEDVPELFPDAFPWGYAFFGFTGPRANSNCPVDGFVWSKAVRSLPWHPPL